MAEADAARGSLWVRYVDWCSAQVARRLLEMSAEEFWERAERQTRTDGVSRPLSRSVVPLARQLSMELYEELGLPPFTRWVEEYREHPERFDPDILGFQAPAATSLSGPDDR
jgi:hypothetical protein